jgi:hypothetical protein
MSPRACGSECPPASRWGSRLGQGSSGCRCCPSRRLAGAAGHAGRRPFRRRPRALRRRPRAVSARRRLGAPVRRAAADVSRAHGGRRLRGTPRALTGRTGGRLLDPAGGGCHGAAARSAGRARPRVFILYDGVGLSALETAAITPRPRPSQERLDQLSNEFWYHLLWGAKKLRRGELLLAKQVCDCYLTERVVELARWRTHNQDTWHGYRFFERWAGAGHGRGAPATFTQYDPGDIGRALRSKGELSESWNTTSCSDSGSSNRSIAVRSCAAWRIARR